MKLCIVTHVVKKGDGQGRVNYEVTWEAIHRGYSITLLASEVAPELLQCHQVDWVPISVQAFPTALLRNISFSKQSSNWLHQHHHQIDLVNTNGAITSFPSDVNSVHFIHSSWLKSPAHTFYQRRDFYGLYQGFYTALNAYFERKAFFKTQKLVAVSNSVKQDLLKLGISSNQIIVISNGVDLEEFRPGFIERKKLNLPDDVNLALFVGDIKTPRKNLDTVLQALAEVPELHLAVVGTIEGSPYPSLTLKLGIQERVHFLGYRQDIPEIMKACDFLVFPSRYETFGLVIIEAMATGLPVITTSTTGAAELVAPESGFVLSDPDDTQSLVQALTTLTRDWDIRHSMGQAARAIAEQHSWKSIAKSYVDLFEAVHSKE